MGTVIMNVEKGENIVDVQLSAYSFYKEGNRLYCDLGYDVSFKSGRIVRYEIIKVNTNVLLDRFSLESNGYAKVICWENLRKSETLMYYNNFNVKEIKAADPIEVTIEEIEKKFGRKVKIVEKKEDEKDD